MTKEQLFEKWRKMGQSPERLLDNYAARNSFTKDDVTQILGIIRYAEWLAVRAANKGEKT
jgi:hypothetical protein